VEITIRGEELIGKSDERIRVRQEAIAALDARIERRAGDLPFDTRADDWTTVPKLETERRVHRDTVLRVSLIRNGPRPQELYSLSVADLRLAGVVAFDKNDATVSATGWDQRRDDPIIDGLKLTISGEQLRTIVDERIAEHRGQADWWTRQRHRTVEEQTEEEPLLPDHRWENEAERHGWRAEALAFLRDHLDSTKTCRIGEADLAFAELLHHAGLRRTGIRATHERRIQSRTIDEMCRASVDARVVSPAVVDRRRRMR
jgi:hypothetical protein